MLIFHKKLTEAAKRTARPWTMSMSFMPVAVWRDHTAEKYSMIGLTYVVTSKELDRVRFTVLRGHIPWEVTLAMSATQDSVRYRQAKESLGLPRDDLNADGVGGDEQFGTRFVDADDGTVTGV